MDFAGHVLDDIGVDAEGLHVGSRALHEVGEVFLDIGQRSFQVGVVELVGHAPAERAELSSFNDN